MFFIDFEIRSINVDGIFDIIIIIIIIIIVIIVIIIIVIIIIMVWRILFCHFAQGHPLETSVTTFLGVLREVCKSQIISSGGVARYYNVKSRLYSMIDYILYNILFYISYIIKYFIEKAKKL